MVAKPTGTYVRANGIDIYHLDSGEGAPLLLLNNGMISTNPVWADWVSSYTKYRDLLAQHFRVIEPDFRGSGRTVNPGGPVSYHLLAEDALALIDALDLDQPFLAGYGDGAEVASIVGIRQPWSARAILNHGGFDLFNPDTQSPGLVLTRQSLGGRPDATEADPDAVANHEWLSSMVELMKADHDAAQGTGHWKTVLRTTFDRCNHPHGYTVDDMSAITASTLVIVGDRDPFCSVEAAAGVYRALRDGELAVLPNTAAGLSLPAVQAMIEFFERR